MSIESTTTTTVTRPSTYGSIGLLILRLPLAAIFIAAGIMKLNMVTDKFVEIALPGATKILTESLARMYLGALPWVELAVGVLLAVGLLTRAVALTISLMLVSFMIAATGVSGSEMKMLFHPNVFYLCVALAILFCGPGWMSVDGMIFRPRRRVVIREEDSRVVP